MNKARFGSPEISILCWAVGLILMMIMIGMGMPLIYMTLMVAVMIFTLFGAAWCPYYICKYKLRPAIDRCVPGETTWLRITKDHIIVPQFVNKGSYGQTKGVTFKDKADVLDDGEFAVKWLNGNPGVIMYDLMNTNVDLNKSVARKLMKKQYNIRTGIEGYERAKKEGKRIFDLPGGKILKRRTKT